MLCPWCYSNTLTPRHTYSRHHLCGGNHSTFQFTNHLFADLVEEASKTWELGGGRERLPSVVCDSCLDTAFGSAMEVDVYTHVHTCAHMYTYMHTQVHTHAQTCTHMYTHVHTCTHTCTHKYTHMHKHVHTCTHMYTYMHTQVHTHAHTCTHTHIPHLIMCKVGWHKS